MRILLVDDNADVLESMALVLGSAGHEVEASGNAAEAMRIHATRPADALITDIFMPGTDGLETIVAFRERWPRLKIVAMSGGGRVARHDYLDVAGEIGADVMLRKPVEPHELLRIVDALVSRDG